MQTLRAEACHRHSPLPACTLLNFQPLGLELDVENLRQAPSKLFQDHLLSQAWGTVFLLCFLTLGQQAGTCGLHYFPGDAGEGLPGERHSYLAAPNHSSRADGSVERLPTSPPPQGPGNISEDRYRTGSFHTLEWMGEGFMRPQPSLRKAW